MNWRNEWKKLAAIVVVFLAFFWLPVGWARFDNAVMESLHLTKWYAREHVLLCLVPAFFIAGAIGVFVSQASVMKYLGARANKVLAYGVAVVSGTILAVCSCTVLPLFAGIWRMGAGLGPATAFLYSGPAINVLAIILTARILGLELGIARAVGAIGFSVVIGLIMHLIYRKEELAKARRQTAMPEPEVRRPLWQNAALLRGHDRHPGLRQLGRAERLRLPARRWPAAPRRRGQGPGESAADGASYSLKVISGPDEGEQISVRCRRDRGQDADTRARGRPSGRTSGW